MYMRTILWCREAAHEGSPSILCWNNQRWFLYRSTQPDKTDHLRRGWFLADSAPNPDLLGNMIIINTNQDPSLGVTRTSAAGFLFPEDRNPSPLHPTRRLASDARCLDRFPVKIIRQPCQETITKEWIPSQMSIQDDSFLSLFYIWIVFFRQDQLTMFEYSGGCRRFRWAESVCCCRTTTCLRSMERKYEGWKINSSQVLGDPLILYPPLSFIFFLFPATYRGRKKEEAGSIVQ